VEAFFVLDDLQPGTGATDSNGGASNSDPRICWPPSVRQTPLESVIVGKGFCPCPAKFRAKSPVGFDGEQFVFSLLETTIEPHADPSSALYACVCGEEQHDGHRAGVLCLVSRLPLFSFFFGILSILQRDLTCVADLLDRLNTHGLTRNLVDEGLEIRDLYNDQGPLTLRLPRPVIGNWYGLVDEQATAAPLGDASKTLARWQAAWGIETIFAQWPNLIGDTLAKLLACVLLEQKVLLLGDAQRVSTVAVLLRSLLWPFRWLHPFLPAPPPSELLKIPFLEAMFPIILSLVELPMEWKYRTIYELPIEVVTGVLRHDYVYVSQELMTAGGLKGNSLKLPAARHAALVKKMSRSRQNLRKGVLSMEAAVQDVQEACEAEVEHLAEIVRRYAAAQLADAREETLQSEKPMPSVEELHRLASEQATFENWLQGFERTVAHGGLESFAFYRSFFQTQLCLDLLNEELIAQTAGSSEPLAVEWHTARQL
jgi:hypothetical protein